MTAMFTSAVYDGVAATVTCVKRNGRLLSGAGHFVSKEQGPVRIGQEAGWTLQLV
jgi:hypothetical protein